MQLNPYQPPLGAEPAPGPADPAFELPRSLRLLSIGYFVAVALLFAAAGSQAIRLRLLMWEPLGAKPVDYMEAYPRHALCMFALAAGPTVFGALGHAFLPRALQIRSAPTVIPGVVGAAALAAAAGVLRQTSLQSVGGSTVGVAYALTALGLAATGVQGALLAKRGFHARMLDQLLCSAFALAFAGNLCAVGWAAWKLLGAASLDAYWLGLPVSNAVLLCNVAGAFVVGVHVIARSRDTAGARLLVILGIVPATLVWIAAMLVTLTLGIDLRLHDTYFDVGTLHAAGSAIVLGFAAGALAWLPSLLRRPANPWLARLGALLASAGMHATTVSMFVLGTRGMPRRYMTYLDTFRDMHRAVGYSAVVGALGFVVIALALLVPLLQRRAP